MDNIHNYFCHETNINFFLMHCVFKSSIAVPQRYHTVFITYTKLEKHPRSWYKHHIIVQYRHKVIMPIEDWKKTKLMLLLFRLQTQIPIRPPWHTQTATRLTTRIWPKHFPHHRLYKISYKLHSRNSTVPMTMEFLPVGTRHQIHKGSKSEVEESYISNYCERWKTQRRWSQVVGNNT